MAESKTCCIIVYGCAKNQVDGEEMASRLRGAGYRLSGDPSDADVVVVHTCGFIEDAKRESIEGILQACQAATERGSSAGGKRAPVVVTGCLSQRYPKDLLDEIPEIAGVAGTAAPRDIVEIVGSALAGHRVDRVGLPGRGAPGAGVSRLSLLAGTAWAYVRISEGCRHRCTYCAIPSMRGTLVSRQSGDVLAEVRALAAAGVREIDLIAQDVSDYGYDFAGQRLLARLVRSLAAVPGVAWIRLLYLRPDGVTPELADAMASPGVVPYVDLPVEHGSAKILRLMGRPGPDRILEAVRILRASVPGLFVRTTVIAGFPGETEGDVEETLGLLKAMEAHRVGVFPYSPEEGTPAYGLPRPVPPEIARERAELVRRFGLDLAKESSESLVGKEIPVLLVKPSVRPGYWVGRGPHQAPEVDGRTYVRLRSKPPAARVSASPDLLAIPAERFITVRVSRAGVLDLFASQG